MDAAAKIVQRRDGKTGAVARLEQRMPLSPDEHAKLVGGVTTDTSPWSLLLSYSYGKEDEDVMSLVDKLMNQSERLKAAALASESLVAAAKGLRVPRASGPSNNKEREELEKKLPTSVSVKPDELYRFSTAYLSLTNLIKVHLPVSAVVTKIMTPGVEHTH